MKGHELEVAALAAVVRSVFTDLTASHRPARARAEAALSAVERWLAGVSVSEDELQRFASSAHEDGMPRLEREQDRALSWANTAAGNLAWMAKKERGWKEGIRSTLDAMSYALSSLNVPGVATLDDLEQRRNAALIRASAQTSAVARSPRRSLASKPRRVGDEHLPFIGAVACARLRANNAIFDPSRRADDAQLSALLLAKGYPDHPALHVFEQRYGGLLFADAKGMEGTDWQFGVFACASQQAPDAAQAALVPVACSPNDVVYGLDAQGAGWAQDMIEDLEPMPFARTGDQLVTLLLLQHCAFSWHSVSLDGHAGEQAAAALGVPALPEASCDWVRAWGSTTALVIEQRETRAAGELWVTRVAAKSKRTLKSIVAP